MYIYYTDEDPVQRRTCLLMTSSGLHQAVEPCENYLMGPGQCRVNEVCQAAVNANGTVTNAIFAEESSVVTLVANEKNCFVDLDVIAIGAGGELCKWHGCRSW